MNRLPAALVAIVCVFLLVIGAVLVLTLQTPQQIQIPVPIQTPPTQQQPSYKPPVQQQPTYKPPATAPTPTPAVISLTNLYAYPSQVLPEKAVTITVVITNTGGMDGEYPLILKINGNEEAQGNWTITAHSTMSLPYSVTASTPGNYTVSVGELTASFTVVAPAPPSYEPPVPTYNPPATLLTQLGRGQYLIAQDGTYLGILDFQFASKSIFNDFGKYGSEFSSTSIWNDFSKYGSEFSSLSAFNDFASKPPMLFDGDNFKYYVTTNTFKIPRVSPYSLIAFAESMGWK